MSMHDLLQVSSASGALAAALTVFNALVLAVLYSRVRAAGPQAPRRRL